MESFLLLGNADTAVRLRISAASPGTAALRLDWNPTLSTMPVTKVFNVLDVLGTSVKTHGQAVSALRIHDHHNTKNTCDNKTHFKAQRRQWRGQPRIVSERICVLRV